MSLKLKLPHCKVRFAVFIIYNMFYVLYMMGYTGQLYYLGSLIVFCCMNGIIFLLKKGRFQNGKREFRLGVGYVFCFFIISVFVQCINMDFESYLMSGLIRIALPIVNAFLFVNTVDESDWKYFFNALLFRFVIHFVWQNYSYLNISGLKSISWRDSNSDMESSMAHDFLIMEMYYLYRDEKKKALVSVILCMLSMKRLSFILAPLLFVFSGRVPKHVEVKKVFCDLLKAVAIISPFLLILLYSKTSQNWFANTLHVDLNLIMSGRLRIYEIMRENMPYYNGYGSINHFLAQYVMQLYGTTWNAILHNDFLRLFFETTIIGVVVFTNNIIEIAKKEYWFFFMISYLILVAITSHILNYFSVWITFYMIVMAHSKSNNAEEYNR